MNILCMDIRLLVPAIQALGHNVLSWVPQNGGLYNLPAFLHEQKFKPDLVIQAENLGPRRLLEGLEEIDCPKIFWAIDSHLNLYWHKYYARLFDAVFTPHLSLWETLPATEKHPLVRQMARQGADLPWQPHSQRLYALSFVGIQNKHRPLRTWLCELISSRWPLEQRQGIRFSEMLELYRNTRIVPNEAIAFEVNYRLMEAASAGAVALTPDIGADQNALFEPGQEIVVYNNACEMMSAIEELLADPDRAESIAYAGWKRIQRDHLPINRARQILQMAESIRQGRTPEEYNGLSRQFFFDSNLWLSRVQGSRGGNLGFSGPSAANTLPLRPFPPGNGQTGETFNLSLRLLLETKNNPELLPLIREYYHFNPYPENIELAVAASFGAMRLGDEELATRIFGRACAGVHLKNNPRPGNLNDFCLAWAELLIKRGHKACSGFIFDPKFHIPSTAMDVLIYLELMCPGQHKAQLLELANLALLGERALTYFRLGYLARQGLVNPENWQIQLEYGIANLICYRLQEGLHELNEAAWKAEQTGGLKAFLRLLSLHDQSGSIVRELLLEYKQI